jgi:pilus assembly protein Flp/PilA
MTNIFSRFLKDESGATAIEYGLIAAIVGVGIITGLGTLTKALNGIFTEVGTKLDAQ